MVDFWFFSGILSNMNTKDKSLIAKMEQMFNKLGIEAVINHPDAHKYAMVNPVDKFVLVMRDEVEGVIMDTVGRFNQRWQWDWWREMNDKPWNEAHKSRMAAFVNGIVADAYLKLRA
jgi:hypothetical protein